jgi:pSer/pThr/pTyr-binding forkhead associated (FHA) protein
VEVELPQTGDFMLLESQTFEKNSSRIVHVITPNTQSEFKMGRGSEADLKVADISVSRVHCHMRINEKGFYLEDN